MNLANIIRQGSQYFPDNEAIVFEGRRFTYRQLNLAVDIVAYSLRDLGVRPGDRMALYCENRPEWVMLYYGIIRLGAAVVCVSSAYRKTELEYLLKDSQPACVVTSDKLAAHIPPQATLPDVKDIVVIEEDDRLSGLGRKVEGEAVAPFPGQDCEREDPCVILYTGGTTG
ncbi:MAG: AMP-binding protein, partial [Desulfosarcinaceae bacterium]